jgi:multiple antibiotic resistance protein
VSIAGGIILFLIGLKMIFPQPGGVAGLTSDEEPFIVPLAIPMIAGPSILAALILLANQEHNRMLDWSLALGATWLASATILMLSSTLHRILGERGLIAIERLMGMGMILIMISIQMLLDVIGQYYSLG